VRISPTERESIRLMFGGKCAYCGDELSGKWHLDHVEPVRRESVYVPGEVSRSNYPNMRSTGKLFAPQNDRRENLYPSCVACNILKGASDVEGFRQVLAYFARSVPKIKTYSHVRHLMRFGKLIIDPTPVEFWFEKYRRGMRQ